MGPAKCKVCGIAEWGHRCAGAIIAKERKSFQPKTVPKLSGGIDPPVVSRGLPASPINAESVETGISAAFTKAEKRKEYLKLKARERRGRERAKKAGK